MDEQSQSPAAEYRVVAIRPDGTRKVVWSWMGHATATKFAAIYRGYPSASRQYREVVIEQLGPDEVSDWRRYFREWIESS
jgi:hypothetical protein